MTEKLNELKKLVESQHSNSIKMAEIFDNYAISDEANEISKILYEQIHILSNIYENTVIVERLFYSTLKIIESQEN